MTEITERWLSVPGYEGLYEVSDLGRVRSLPRKATDGRLLKGTRDRHGYAQVTLSKHGHVKRRYIHHLVLLAFVGPRPDGRDTRHGPGGKTDNRLSNLSYGTRAENERDKIRDGTFRHGGGTYVGEAHHQAKLTAAIVAECRRRAAAGEMQIALAREFGISQSAMQSAISGRTWRHVPMFRTREQPR